MRRLALALLVLAVPGLVSAAVTYVGVGSTAPVISTGTCTPTTASVSWVAGDYLVVIAGGEGASAASGALTLGTANGFTAIANTGAFWNDGDATDETGETAVQAWGKIATSAADSMPVVADSGDNTTCLLIVFHGVDQTTPVACAAADGTDASDTSGSFPSCTTGVANSMILMVEHDTDDAADTTGASGYTNANLASITEREDQTSATGLGGGFTVVTATYAGTGDFGATTWTADNVRRKSMFSIALQPAPPVCGTGTLSERGSQQHNTSTTGQTVAVTVPSIEDGDLVVALANSNNNTVDVNTVTSPNLTWTRRQALHNTSGGFAGVYTAVRSGTTLTNQVVTFTDDDGSNGGRSITTIVYQAGTWHTGQDFSNGATASGSSTTPSVSLTVCDNDARLVAAVHGNGTAEAGTPTGNTTEYYDITGASASMLHGADESATTSKTASWSWSGSKTWRTAALEIVPADGSSGATSNLGSLASPTTLGAASTTGASTATTASLASPSGLNALSAGASISSDLVSLASPTVLGSASSTGASTATLASQPSLTTIGAPSATGASASTLAALPSASSLFSVSVDEGTGGASSDLASLSCLSTLGATSATGAAASDLASLLSASSAGAAGATGAAASGLASLASATSGGAASATGASGSDLASLPSASTTGAMSATGAADLALSSLSSTSVLHEVSVVIDAGATATLASLSSVARIGRAFWGTPDQLLQLLNTCSQSEGGTLQRGGTLRGGR